MTLAVVGPASAQSAASVRGVVTDGTSPVAGVAVDLFTAEADGTRIEFLRSVTTSATGFEFPVDPGCYTVTFIAPTGRSFLDGGGWANVGVCVEAGDLRDDVDAVLLPVVEATVAGAVSDDNSNPVDGITVDLFTALADGERGVYLRAVATGADGQPGRFTFTVDPGCYVLTFIAGSGRTFLESGTPWLNRPFCVEPGAAVDGLYATLLRSDAATIVAEVQRSDGSPAEGVVVDLFVQDVSGERAGYVTSARTDTTGRARFSPEPGCYVLTFIAPADDVWQATGTSWLNSGVCVAAGETSTAAPAVLVGQGQTIVVLTKVTHEGRAVPGVLIDVFKAGPDGSRGSFVGDITTAEPVRGGEDTRFHIFPGAGCWVLTYTARESDSFTESGTRWLNRSFCTTPDQTFYTFEEFLALRPNQVETVELDQAPHRVSGQVDAVTGADYRVVGEPGQKVALEILDLGPRFTCEWEQDFALVIKTDTELIERATPVMCNAAGPWTIPAGGELIIGFRSARGETVPYEAVLAEVDYDEVELDLSPGSSVTVSGTITLPRGGTEYIVRGQPGQAISVGNAVATCEVVTWGMAVRVLDADGNPIENVGGCWGPFEIPDNGMVRVRVSHERGRIVERPDVQSYTFVIALIDYDTVVVAPGESPVEFVGEVEVPLDGAYYVFDASSFDMLDVVLVNPGPGRECIVGKVVAFDIWIDDRFVRSHQFCEDRLQIDAADATTIRIRIRGLGFLREPPEGSFRVRFEQLVFERIPVDLRSGPVEVTGTLANSADRVDYVVTAPPGSLVSAADVGEWLAERSCGWNSPGLELSFDVSGPAGDWSPVRSIEDCYRSGPWLVPADGTLILRAGPKDTRDTGAYRYTLSSFANRQETIDLDAGPVEATATLLHPLDGVTYLIKGQPGQQIQIQIKDLSMLDGESVCADRLRFGLEVEARRASLPWWWDSYDVGYNGCIRIGSWTVDDDGSLWLRFRNGGQGIEYRGSYTVIFSRVG